MATSQLPIGVFDSGVGGLTVLSVLAREFPDENFIYLGDSARLPYGTKSPKTIRKYTEQALGFLTEMKVKAIIIACNSASSQFRETSFAGVPVENVIDPGVATALKTTSGRVGVLGTRATIASKVYEQKLLQAAFEQKRELQVFSAEATLFVPLAEEAWIDDPVTNLIVFRYVQPLLAQQIDTLILGCTHYPILRSSIQRAAGSSVTLIDSGVALAEILKHKFEAKILVRRNPDTNQNPRKIELLTTEESASFTLMAQRILGEQKITSIRTAELQTG